MQDLIPLYSADGELRDWISGQRMNRRDRLGLIRIVKHKKGRVSRCIMPRRPGDPTPTPRSVYRGTRYSYVERLEVKAKRFVIARQIRDKLLAIPALLSLQLAALADAREVRELLEAEIVAILRALQDGIRHAISHGAGRR